MELNVNYLGFDLPHPFIPGAGPLTRDVDMVRRLEDAGAKMIVMPSLFEEQLLAEQTATDSSLNEPAESFAEALSYFPDPEEFRIGPDDYLEAIGKLKADTDLIVVASLNGTRDGRWVEYARQMEQAGADALELNVYYVATDPKETGVEIEQRTIDLVRSVKGSVGVPVAVKISPYYSSLASFASQLKDAGADALVIFNRFYQPDIDVEELEVVRVNLSDSSELLKRLSWLGILNAQLDLPLSATGGVQNEIDAVKCIMAGATTIQIVSSLLRYGPNHLTNIRQQMVEWLEEHEYVSLAQLRGSMDLKHCPDPAAYQRVNYMQILQSWST